MSALLLALALAAAPEPQAEESAEVEVEAGTPLPDTWVPAAHAAGLMVGMRLSLSALWPQAFHPLPLRRSAERFAQHWSVPPDFRTDRALFESDGDPWALNVVGHGLFGSEVYLRARQCGHSPQWALAATAIASTFWEYGVEAFHKRPSAVDLVWTPLSGIALGELRYWLYQASSNRVLRLVVDPLGAAERALGARC